MGLPAKPLSEREQDNHQEVGHADCLGQNIPAANEPGPRTRRADQAADITITFGLSDLAHDSAVTVDDLGDTRTGRSHCRPGSLQGAITGYAALLLPLVNIQLVGLMRRVFVKFASEPVIAMPKLYPGGTELTTLSFHWPWPLST